MSSPYRDTRVTEDAGEPEPQFRPPPTDRRDLLIMVAFVLLASLLESVTGGGSAWVIMALGLPVVAFAGITCALQEPARQWLAHRYARRVVRGIGALEARAANPCPADRKPR